MEQSFCLVTSNIRILTALVQSLSVKLTPNFEISSVFSESTKSDFFSELIARYNLIADWNLISIETEFKNLATEKNSQIGELQMLLRVILVGSKMGPGVFVIAEAIGKTETVNRIEKALVNFSMF